MSSPHANSTALSPARALLLALAAALIPYGLLVTRFDFVCDDAFISFRYARHLAGGHGLRFNLGEETPVEGYSNLLWVLWSALFERLGADVALAARVTSIAAGAALLAWTTRLAQRRLDLGPAATLATALFLATLPPLAVWSTGGLETMPFALAVLALFASLLGDPARPRGLSAAALAGLAALLRTDGAVWAAMVLAAAGAAAVLERDLARRRGLIRAISVAGAGLVAVVLAHTAWRAGYHGDLVANTARVKAGLSGLRLERGLRYVAGFLLAVPSCPLALGAAALLRKGADRALAAASTVLVVAAFGYAALVGGDFMAMGRLLVPALPFVALLFAGAVRSLARGSASAALAASAVLLSLAAAFDRNPVPRSVRERCHFRWNSPAFESEVEVWRAMRERARLWTLQGRALALHTRPGESMIAPAIGAVGYFSELELLDLFGLVDRDVARREVPHQRLSPGHDKFVTPEFFFPRRPTYYGSVLAPADAPLDEGLVPDFERSALSSIVAVERASLDPADGFPPGLELRLFRFRWD